MRRRGVKQSESTGKGPEESSSRQFRGMRGGRKFDPFSDDPPHETGSSRRENRFLIEVRNLIRTRTDWSASSPLKSRNRSFLDVSSPSAGVTFLSEGCCRSERRVYVMWRRMVFSVAFHKRSGGRRCQSRGKWQTFETMALSIKQGGICELER